MPSVDIPGIGTVFADGFAQESTLQSLLQVMSQQQSGGGSDPTAVLKSQSSSAARAIASLGSQTKDAGNNVNEGGNSAYQGLTAAGRGGRNFSDSIGKYCQEFNQPENRIAILQNCLLFFKLRKF